VSAVDKATGKEQSIRIEGSGGLSTDEIDKMVRDAEANAAEDKKRRELSEKRNHLDTTLYQAEKLLADNGDKLDADEKSSVEAAIAEGKTKLESDDVGALEAAQKSVESALHSVAEKLYQAGASEAGAEADAAADAHGASDEDVIDAEYTEEKGDS